MNERVIVALDVDFETAIKLVQQLGEDVVFYKVGLSLFFEAGEKVVSLLKEKGKKVFLDLKLADIPFQVERAVKALAKLKPELLTVHAFAGEETIRSAKKEAGKEISVIAVTILTSQPGEKDVRERVLQLASVAILAGADGIVCSGYEVKEFKLNFPDKIAVVPGIRLAQGREDDQRRVVLPEEAIANGADYIVVGREITRAKDPRKAFETILKRIEQVKI
jgi:orotidine-5'-phosphate decarboxylase